MGEVLNLWQKQAPTAYGTNEQRNIKALLGWGGLILRDDGIHVVSLLRDYLVAVQEESCGRCVTCRLGSKLILDVLNRIVQGQGQTEDLERLERLGKVTRDGSLCELGRTFPIPLLEAIQDKRDSFLQAINGKKPLPEVKGEKHKLSVAPCQNLCPAHLDIPQYVQQIKESTYEKALATVREKTFLAGVLGRVCVRFCENGCNRGDLDSPVSICGLKRFVADQELNLRRRPHWPSSGKKEKVAIIGAGPAGLNAAYQLALKGYRATIFEACSKPGGMLLLGIPAYRLPRHIIQQEVDMLKDLGVEIKLNTRVGRDITLDELRKQYQAVFIASGRHDSRKMGLEGEEDGYAGFLPGVSFLHNANMERETGIGKKVAVVGGGNVAMDCARVSLRLGAEEVHLIYRRSRSEMPAHHEEIEAAEAEGVQYHFLANPTRMIYKDGMVAGVECIRMELGEPDASGRRRPVEIPGSEFTMEIDTFIPAIGQVAETDFLTGIEMSRQSVVIDPHTLATNLPGVFAGGDLVSGEGTVIEAIADGNRAALSIDQFLREGEAKASPEEEFYALTGYLDKACKGCKVDAVAGRKREEGEEMPVNKRINCFDEVVEVLRNEAAIKEAERCLRCYRLVMVVE